MADLRFDTKALHAGYDYAEGGSIFPPLYMAVAFPFESGEHGWQLATKQVEGHGYARSGNPTNDVFERRLAALEGGEACLATSSGLAAIFTAIIGLLEEPGAEFVTSNRLYGNTLNQFRRSFPLMGITPRFVEAPENLDAWESLITPKTRFLYVESPSNPLLFVADLKGLIRLAKVHHLPIVVDSTLATPVIQRPLETGADVVVHSTTKYLSGHSAALGGAIVGSKAYVEKLRSGHHYYLGPTMSAFNAWLTLIGMETLGLRMPRVVGSAQRVAEFLASHPAVVSVNYPGLPAHPQHQLAREQMGGGGTSLLSFVIEGSIQDAWSVIERLKVPCHTGHLGGNQSIVVHPPSTMYGKLTPVERAELGVPEGLIRLSVGLEDPGDLIADLEQALSIAVPVAARS
ncbi:MAG: aminotransferase class I/II-fold pyridoxal phosphate-dependent enzyme [Chloroflexi bacterium]|nr:aminotransferase class I/II-fold pyridoxal phosphate-dependent enzyme [Chloroflexota bacterium]